MRIGPLIIGLTGLPGSGKDTAAHFLERNYGFARLAFADALREEVKNAWARLDDFWLQDRVCKEARDPALALERCPDAAFALAMRSAGLDMREARSPRQILQLWGTEYRRARDPHYWLHRAEDRIADLRSLGVDRVVLTDVRFPNEAAMVRAAKGELWKVHRIYSLAASEHASDHALANQITDVVLHNHGSIEQLEHEIDRVMHHPSRRTAQ